MFLPPCTLAKIFRRNITKWNDGEIVAANPHLPDLETVEANINVVVRKSGSSSTYAITHYFQRCARRWKTTATSSGAQQSASCLQKHIRIQTEEEFAASENMTVRQCQDAKSSGEDGG